MRKSVLTLAVVAGLLTIGVGGPADAATGAAPPFDIESVRVPAVCGHPATRLSGGVHRFTAPDGGSRGLVALVSRTHSFATPVRAPLLAHQQGTAAPKVSLVAPIRCSSGGVDHPETLVVYSRFGKILATTDLGRIGKQEHEAVTAVSLRDDHLRAHWDAYDGAGFHLHHQAATFTLRHGKLVASHVVLGR